MKKIIKKLLIITLAAVTAITAMPLTGIDAADIFTFKASAAEKSEPFMWGDYECIIINTNEVEIKTYYGDDTEIVIPSEINGMPVTSIGENSFHGNDRSYYHPNSANNNNIRRVVIPSSVKSIGHEAFTFIESLSEVILSEGLEIIGEFAFADCPLLTEIRLPESFKSFSFTSFENTGITELVLGSNVTNLSLYDFEESVLKKIICNAENVYIEKINLTVRDTALSEIVFNGIFTVDSESLLTSFGNIKTITCKNGADYDTIVYMREAGFYHCFNPDGSVVFSSDESIKSEISVSDGFGYYINGNNEAVITQYFGNEENVIIPETLGGNYPVTVLDDFCFANFDYDGTTSETDPFIKSISLPDTIKKIGMCAFAGNAGLTEINLPENLTTVPYECFKDCTSLQYVDIPEGVVEIESRAFYFCENLKSISLPEGVKEIGENAFRGCYDLVTVGMPGVEKIGDEAFCYCHSLVINELPENLTEIGVEAFYRCKSIEHLDLSKVTRIGRFAFGECRKLKEVILNDNLEYLEKGVFQACHALESIRLPSKLVSVGSKCFYNSGLKNVTFNEGLKTIESGAFFACSNLADVVLPESIEYIWSSAFSQCNSITEITLPKNLKILGYHVFSRNANLTTVYFNATDCKVCQKPGEEEFVPVDWATASPFYATKITNIYFGENITAISNDSETCGTFENCETLEAVTIPDSVEVIGTAAFKNCSNLETAIIPDSVEKIADDAFVGCSSLTIYCSETSYAYSYATANGISVSTFVISSIPNQVYTGSAIKPSFTVTLSGKVLTKGVDYSVSYSNNINVGHATVVIQGMGSYDKFSGKATFTIVTRSISKASIADINPQKYTGSQVKPSLTVTDNGRYLKEGKDYNVYYYNNINYGTAYVSVAGTGNYSGSVQKSFVIKELDGSELFINRFISFITDFFAKFFGIFTVL